MPQGWLEVLNAAGWIEEATGFIHCLSEGLLGLFDNSWFARFSESILVGLLECRFGIQR